jgi:lipoate---protein ligase
VKLLDLTLATPAENLALDEALLEQAEEAGGSDETLRLWESPQPFVVMGRASRTADEVDLQQCRQLGLPVLRRCSGGASVVVGPGCLMYALVLSYRRRPPLRMLNEAHRLVLDTLAQALQPLLPEVRFQGTSDLTWGNRKFSGNSLRCKRTHLLYHGTLLYDFPLGMISACLRSPPRQPEYRGDRAHDSFVMNLPLDGDRLRTALANAWNVDGRLSDWPRQRMQQLSETRYQTDEWNFRH